MTDKEIEKAAEEYVLKRQVARHNAKDEYEATMADFDRSRQVWDAFDMEQSFKDGAHFALSHQWVSVEERLPEDDSYFYLVADVRLAPLGVDCAEYSCETKLFSRGGKILHPTHWCPIPPLNPEKE